MDYNYLGYKYLNMNAVVGEFQEKNPYSGLNEMKLGFNTLVTEYIGEFDIVLNSFTYNLYKNFNKNKQNSRSTILFLVAKQKAVVKDSRF